MSPERKGTILGAIVAVAVLAAAVIYVPIGSRTMTAKPSAAPEQAPAAPVAAPRGPVVREVPN